ncbi:NAD(P)-dependent oxidoreductase [Candidatus Chloroploca asiatica]|uniref:Hydroxyacid dehydrogenase n=1 Tax=Candidatus Chloroploca asiatica TaxID=1506545 RepID=A0A2H3KH77_9CHLR|nr:NAD(P)-dependent oxidoreductase [Candidatus Chloroploca asiatica]PDV97114.1 hydroxyacid dehydrogenase [Candidatus Chloroploca asiatica]
MSAFPEHDAPAAAYDLIHFEALGPEADHLREATSIAMERGELPPTHTSLMTPRTVQDYLEEHPEARLPRLITLKTHSVLPANYLAGAKKSVITRSAGYDHLEHLAATVNLASLREYCVTAVAQTVMKLLYAAAGELNHYTHQTATFDRKNSRAFIELGPHKSLTVYGVGKIGKRVYELAAANGLSVQGVDLRQDALKNVYGEGFTFVSKDEAIMSSDIIVNAMNLTKNQASPLYNVGYFSQAYLSRARDGLIFINVTRGEIAPEAGLWDLYRAGKIMGLGLDVFSSEAEFATLVSSDEKVGDDHAAARHMVRKALDRSANIYVQPHQGFNSDLAARTKAFEAIKHVVAWHRNQGTCFDEQLPYY